MIKSSPARKDEPMSAAILEVVYFLGSLTKKLENTHFWDSQISKKMFHGWDETVAIPAF
jgi:hypothetical protein